MDDIQDDPEFQKFADAVRTDLIPKLEDSGGTLMIAPDGEPDIKFAVELGMSILLDKPICVLTLPGRTIPPGLAKVADLVIEGDPTTPEGRQEMADRGLMDFIANHGVSQQPGKEVSQ